MGETKTYHMTSDEFRRYGRAMVDWIADYYDRIESFPVLAQVEPGKIRAALLSQPPVQAEPFDVILADVENLILPGITHWQSPNFFAFFPANASGPGILGELLSAGLGVQGMLWATSPACTELETHTLDWLVHMLGLPDKFLSTGAGGGVIQDTASSASLCALLAARERTTGSATNQRGCDGRLVAYASSQAHSSIEKAVKIAGLGEENLRLIPVDDAAYGMRPDALAAQLKQDRQAGKVPCFDGGGAYIADFAMYARLENRGCRGRTGEAILGCLLKRWVPWIAGYVAGGGRTDTSHLAYRGCLRICAFLSLPLAIAR
jgi:aromatic-L-amino-acid decarboxylase